MSSARIFVVGVAMAFAPRAVRWAREEIRTVMFLDLITVLNKPPSERTAQQQSMADHLFDVVQQHQQASR